MRRGRAVLACIAAAGLMISGASERSVLDRVAAELAAKEAA